VHLSAAARPADFVKILEYHRITVTADESVATAFLVTDVSNPPSLIHLASRLRGCILASGVDSAGYVVAPWMQPVAALQTPRKVWMSAAFRQCNPRLSNLARA
jgi:hypothetical protein